MPPPVNLSDINAVRGSLAAADAEIARLGREIDGLRRQREQGARTGAAAADLNRLIAAEAAVRQRQREQLQQRTELGARLGGLVGGVGDAGVFIETPEMAVARLERDLPVVMLPVRLETRFEGIQRLHVRIYPDQIHVHQHDGEMTATEVEAGQRYWKQIWSDAGAAQSAWQQLQIEAVPERAAFVIDRLRPTNLAARATDAVPVFPEVATVERRAPTTAQARLLPSRWLVTLIASDGKRMVRKWAPHPVPDRLSVSPFGNLLAETTDAPEGELALDEETRWLVDFGRAVALGMALTIEQSELEHGSLANGIARLVVVGVDWSRTAQDASSLLAEHLCAHGYSDGLAFLEPGHVTNNTSATNADFRSKESQRGAAFPAEPPPQALPQSAASVLSEALGVAEAQRLARFAGANSRYEATASRVQTALYGASFGFFFTEVIYPYIRRAQFGNIREHVQRYLRPAGPYAAIRVGRQPYGVLPVLATPVAPGGLGELETLPAGFFRQLATMLAKVRMVVEGVTAGERPLDDLRTMAAPPPGVDPEQILAEILKQSPLATSATVRPIGSTGSTSATSDALAAIATRHRNTVNATIGSLGLPVTGFLQDDEGGFRVPLIYELYAPNKPRYSLGTFPWVAEDLSSTDAIAKAVAKVRERIEAAAGDVRNTKNFLAVAASDADTLFEGLLLLSAAFEYWRAAEEVVRRPEFAAQFDGTLLNELIAVGTPAAAPAERTLVETPRQLLQVQARTDVAAAPVSVLSEIHAGVLAAAVGPELRDAREFHDALAGLSDRPASEVDYALRGLMDAGSHRLDAWVTSVATRRLQTLRLSKPHGVHIGGYGFVHDLMPDVTPDSEGYIHVPSADHAVMSAVLRAAHIANRDDKPESFAVRLTSERVRNALYLSDGMAQGQRVSALLGYRFERNLVDGRLQARFINAFRKLAPHPNDAATLAGAQESIGARDVVDGMKLAELWHKSRDASRDAFFDQLGTLTVPSQAIPPLDRTALSAELDKLVDLFDSFGDLWSAESVWQLARGNQDRAAAALAVLDRQERPPEALSVQTPRKCWGYAQRVMWTLRADAQASGWPSDMVSKTEPGANALAAHLLGDPQRFRISAQAVGVDGVVLADIAPAPLGIADLALSPLALAMLSLPGNADQPSRLEQHIATVVARRENLPEGAGIALAREPPGGSPAGSVGLARLLALANAVRVALFDRRALSQRDFAPATGPVADQAAVEPIVERATVLEQELAACETALAAAMPADAAADIPALLTAVARASGVIPVMQWTLTPAARSAPSADVVEEGVATRSRLTAILKQWREMKMPKPVAGPAAAEAAQSAKLELATARIRLVFGAGFPVWAPFTVAAPLLAEWQLSLADQQALFAQRSKLGVVQWLRSLSLVRAGTRALTDALDAAAWSGNSTGGQSAGRVVQLPHLPGRSWVSLPFEGQPPQDVRLSAVLFGELAPAGSPMIGVLLDEWTEAVPEAKTTTSVSFQYDAPGARPPQTICVAVDAGITAGGWTTDSLVDTVNELFDLSRLRLLKPSQIRGAGAVLPTMFIPQNLSKELPSLDLLGITAVRAGMTVADGLLGKG
jgi:hypothetical protein